MILNYSDLQNSVGDFLNRMDLLPVVKTFIQFAEADFNRSLRVREMMTDAPVIVSFTSDTALLPDDFLELRGAPTLGVNGPDLDYKTPEILSAILGDPNETGDPQCYTLVGKSMRIAPVGDVTAWTAPVDIAIFYYRKIPALADATDANWLLLAHPDLYLYTTLIQSAPYLKDDERLQVWGGLQQKILEDIRMANERASYRGATPRIASKGGSIG